MLRQQCRAIVPQEELDHIEVSLHIFADSIDARTIRVDFSDSRRRFHPPLLGLGFSLSIFSDLYVHRDGRFELGGFDDARLPAPAHGVRHYTTGAPGLDD